MSIGSAGAPRPGRGTSISHVERLEPRTLFAAPLKADFSSAKPSSIIAAADFLHPSISGVRPANASTKVARNAFVAADVTLVGSGGVVNDNTLTETNVLLKRADNGAIVPAVLNTSGGGDVIVLTPIALLDANTRYIFTVTAGAKDAAGHSFAPYSSTFTTGASGGETSSDIRFAKVALTNAKGFHYTAVTIGPDHRLYAAGDSGYIVRYDILDDGTLGAGKTIKSVRLANGGPRLITGITFDPASTPSSPILWVSHGYASVLSAPDWTGKISVLSGPNLTKYADKIVNLPRSFKDHLNNQMVFGPDGAIYLGQASMTAMGAPDATWGNRREHLLSAAILRIIPGWLPRSAPLDVKTVGTTYRYNPFAKRAPVQIYASGVRNAYDLLWTRDGHLLAPGNGSARGGNTPPGSAPFSGIRIDSATKGAYTGPSVPAEINLPTQTDFLFDIAQSGYYGHPNPTRDEFVMNGGNPTSGHDSAEVSEYPVGTRPDRNYRGNIWDFGENQSPDGIIQYTGKAFGGALDGKILVAQYSGGDNIVVLTRDPATGKIVSAQQSVIGFTGFVDPLDLVEDEATGNIYVAEYGGMKITLLRPDTSKLVLNPRVNVDQSTMVFNDVKGGAYGEPQTVLIKNQGKHVLWLSSISVLSSETTAQFKVVQRPTLPASVSPGASVTVKVAFNPSSSASAGIHAATLRIKSNDPLRPNYNIALRGFAMNGWAGDNEPSLQRLMDLWQIPDNVGDATPDETRLALPPTLPNDELPMQTLVAASSAPVTIQMLGAFCPAFSPPARIGFYDPKSAAQQELFYVDPGSNQSVHPSITGYTRFTPGSAPFGIYVTFPLNARTSFSQDSLNGWDTGAARGRMLRFYLLKNGDGSVVPNAYVVGVEAISAYSDQQDVMFIIRNVKRAPASAPLPAVSAAVTASSQSSPDAQHLKDLV